MFPPWAPFFSALTADVVTAARNKFRSATKMLRVCLLRGGGRRRVHLEAPTNRLLLGKKTAARTPRSAL
jgi:hypothetical protein